jgi:pyrroloquinoline quinone biosynthesis protein D
MIGFTATDVPRLAARTRIRHDEARNADVLLFPEGVFVLNGPAGAILNLCDGVRSVGDIAATLAAQLDGRDVTADIITLLDRLASRGLVEGNATE